MVKMAAIAQRPRTAAAKVVEASTGDRLLSRKGSAPLRAAAGHAEPGL